MGHRIEQVASTLQRAIQEVLARGLQDPRISGLITVTEVQLSPDLKNARVLFSVLPHEREKLTLHGLEDASRHIRRRVGDLVSMRQVPELTFKLDVGLRKESELNEAISKIAAERGTSAGKETPGAPAPGAATTEDPA